MRASAERAWASRPSSLASVPAVVLKELDTGSFKAIKLTKWTKSHRFNGEAKRAVPPVGITWLGPAT